MLRETRKEREKERDWTEPRQSGVIPRSCGENKGCGMHRHTHTPRYTHLFVILCLFFPHRSAEVVSPPRRWTA